jgi:hypothetical protein
LNFSRRKHDEDMIVRRIAAVLSWTLALANVPRAYSCPISFSLASMALSPSSSIACLIVSYCSARDVLGVLVGLRHPPLAKETAMERALGVIDLVLAPEAILAVVRALGPVRLLGRQLILLFELALTAVCL